MIYQTQMINKLHRYLDAVNILTFSALGVLRNDCRNATLALFGSKSSFSQMVFCLLFINCLRKKRHSYNAAINFEKKFVHLVIDCW